MTHYIFQNKKVVVVSRDVWVEWMERQFELGYESERVVSRTEVGGDTVSTVFLGIDHDWFGTGTPVLFETMIFPDCEYCVRSCTLEEALASHMDAIEYLKKGGERHGKENNQEEEGKIQE